MSERSILYILYLVSWFQELNCHHQKGGDCRSKDFALDVLMMPYVRDVLMPYEKALLKFNSRQKSKNTRYNIKNISSDLEREFQIETAKGLAKKFKHKSKSMASTFEDLDTFNHEKGNIKTILF